jgi:hypothetical protein
MRRWVWLADAIITAVLLLSGYIIGARAQAPAGAGQPQENQPSYDVAIMQACGRGFQGVAYWDVLPPLKAFLDGQAATFNCADLPANWPARNPSLAERGSRYLLGAVALDWRVGGISWSNLRRVSGVLCALAAAAAYWTLRLAMGPIVALALSYAFLTSPLQLANLPHLPDYAKAPFVLGLLALTGWMVKRAHSRRALIVLSIAAGATTGLVIGFSRDVLHLAAAVPFAVLCARVLDHDRRWHIRAEAAVAYGLTFLVLAFPVLRASAATNDVAHAAILGYMTPFDNALGVSPSYYNFGALENDAYASVAINSYAERGGDPGTPIAAPGTGPYTAMSGAYVRQLLAVVPADFVVRGLAAVRNVFNLPFRGASGQSEEQARLSRVVRSALGLFSGAGTLFALAALVAVGTSNGRLACWLGAIGLYLGATSALQFQERHYFHLEVLGLLAAGALIEAIAAMTAGAVRREPVKTTLRPFVTACAWMITAIAVAAAVVMALRVYQQAAVHELVSRLVTARAQVLNGGDVLQDGSILFPASTQGSGAVQAAYLMTSIAPSCRSRSLAITVKYASATPAVAFDQIINVTLPQSAAAPTRVFVPAYTNRFDPQGAFAFDGLAVPASQATCIEFVARVDGPPAGLLPFLVLPAGWERLPAYQRLGRD